MEIIPSVFKIRSCLSLSYLLNLNSEALDVIFKSISIKTGWNCEYCVSKTVKGSLFTWLKPLAVSRSQLCFKAAFKALSLISNRHR